MQRMYTCPVPNCHHVGLIITNNHCMSVHSQTKKEIITKYGDPILLTDDWQVARRNVSLMNINDGFYASV